jgi:hypothetical protein
VVYDSICYGFLRATSIRLLGYPLQRARFSQEYNIRVAEDQEEIEKLLEVGFEYVCEKDGKLFF